MNNKMSFYILFAFLFVAISCKSEVKTNTPVKEDVTVNNQVTDIVVADQTSDDDEGSEVDIKTDKEEDAKTANTTQNNSTTKTDKKKKKPVVDRGIQIEMGMDDTDTETEPEVEKPAKETKKDIETKVKETKPTVDDKVVDEKPSKPIIVDKFKVAPKHSMLNALLQSNVSSSGEVNYKSLKNQESKLDEYLELLENYPPKTSWTRDQKLVYWINAYNAYTLKLILKNYPVKSITDLHGGKPWDVKWIELDGRTLSLNNIENDIIRPEFNEPRIHFAVNCAAKSCPPLLNATYEARTLDTQLESQTKKFINNAAFNTLGKDEIEVSKIFEWYKVDFGDIVSFVIQYADKTVKPGAKVGFKEYDWALNGK